MLTLAVLWGLRGRLPQVVFYLVFAIAVTASVQLVGVYLVFATLIVPALGSRRLARRHAAAARLCDRRRPATRAGLVLSSALDLPSGALIVWCLAMLAILAFATEKRLSVRRERQRK